MSQVILGTLAMMAAAFFIGFVVAYLIKAISASLNYFENFSLSENIAARKRLYSITKSRRSTLKGLLLDAQRQSNDELLEHFYPSKKEKEEKFMNDNEIIRHYYGKH